MDATEDGLKAFLMARTQSHWDEYQQPYFLSRAATDIKAQGIDYRDILKDEKLKEFSRRVRIEDGFRLVEHPSQKAKVGLVPTDIAFQFPVEVDDAQQGGSPQNRVHGQTLLDFLHALSRLPPEDLDAVVLPTRVLVKLATKR